MEGVRGTGDLCNTQGERKAVTGEDVKTAEKYEAPKTNHILTLPVTSPTATRASMPAAGRFSGWAAAVLTLSLGDRCSGLGSKLTGTSPWWGPEAGITAAPLGLSGPLSRRPRMLTLEQTVPHAPRL